MKINRIIIYCLILLGAGLVFGSSPKKYLPTWESLDSRPLPQWFTNAKFGIFIHWGVYSVPAYRPLQKGLYASYAEWYYARVIKDDRHGGSYFHNKNYGKDFEYRQFAPLFKAELFDPDKWAGLFKRSGAKYVVLTSKHHDGYSLWPTKSIYKKDWNSMDIGPLRDLVGELTTAVRKKGLKMGLYYSIIEWETNPTKRIKAGYYIDQKMIKKYAIPLGKYVDHHLIPQLKEIVLNYQPALIFADGGEWDEDENFWQTKEFLAWLYNKAPNKDEVVVNDRWCKGMPGKHGDYYSSEYKDAAKIQEHPWEESRGIGGSYGYNRAEGIDDYNTSQELIHELIDIVSRGGNLLLNVGPASDGRIPVIMQQRLIDIGNWLKINGEAIYETRQWKRVKENTQTNIRFTCKDNKIYVHCLTWPKTDLKIKIPQIIKTVSMLGTLKKIKWNYYKGQLIIKSPIITPDAIKSNYAYVFKITY